MRNINSGNILFIAIFMLLIAGFLTVGTPQLMAQNNVGINSTGANPHPSAALDVDASDKGVLIDHFYNTCKHNFSFCVAKVRRFTKLQWRGL